MVPWLLQTFVFSLLVCFATGKGGVGNNIQYFLKVQSATLSPTTALKTVLNIPAETCATTCLSTGTCKSFEISKYSPYTCLMYKEDTAERTMTRTQDRDFYQLRTTKCPINIVYSGYLSGYNDLPYTVAPLAECVQVCQREPTCNSMEYRFSDNGCYLSSRNQLPLYVNLNNWNYIEVNRTLLSEFSRRPSSNQPIRNECNIQTLEDISSFYKKPVDSSSEMAYFVLEYNPNYVIENMPDTPVRTQVECSVECLRNDECIAFNYHSGKQNTCQLKRVV